MTTDLFFFHESYLDERTLIKFHESLPDHLKKLFESSLAGYEIRHRIDETLQGYRGPHNNGASGDSEYLGPKNGLQEVRYWYGVTKLRNLVPVLGTIGWGIGRLIGDTAWHGLYFDCETEECLSHDVDEAAEKLNNKGNQLFQEEKYTEAAKYYNNALKSSSSGYKNEQTFKDNAEKAKAEIDAISLNSKGDQLFELGNYSGAQRKYQEAFDRSHVKERCNGYEANRQRAQEEEDALNLNLEGDRLFEEGNYSGALRKYQDSEEKSQVSTQKDKYNVNQRKAKVELEAMNLNSLADGLLQRGRFTEALRKYKEASNKSQNKEASDKYSANSKRVLIVIDKLSVLLDLWNKAWKAEKDTVNDRAEEATEILQKMLRESKNCLNLFPDIRRFKQLEVLCCLKLEGNESFNQALESLHKGIELEKEAQEQKQQQKLELACSKFKEAKDKLSDSQEKFKIGSLRDKRFSSCIEFVQDQLDEVKESIEITEEYRSNLGLGNLNIDSSRGNLGTDFCDLERDESKNNYYEHI